ncbi:unnamed protein product, partial [Aphanomyces euteiches]
MERARSHSSFGSHPWTICPVLKVKPRAWQAALLMNVSLESKLRADRRLFKPHAPWSPRSRRSSVPTILAVILVNQRLHLRIYANAMINVNDTNSRSMNKSCSKQLGTAVDRFVAATIDTLEVVTIAIREATAVTQDTKAVVIALEVAAVTAATTID